MSAGRAVYRAVVYRWARRSSRQDWPGPGALQASPGPLIVLDRCDGLPVNISTIRADIQTRLQTIDDLQVYAVTPASPQVPCVIVYPISGLVHEAFERGASNIRFGLQILVQLADWPSAQNALDSYLTVGTTTSIVDAMEQELFGGEDLTVENWDGYGQVDIGGLSYASVTLYVLAMMSS